MKLNKDISRQIEEYLEKEKKPLICVVGPTGSGKTEFALHIAKEFSGELINADSRQIYKGIECITGLDFNEIRDYPHHLFAVSEIRENWSAGKFLKEIREIIDQIYLRNNLPIVVGGTGLFITSLIEGYEMPNSSKSDIIRDLFKNKTNKELFCELDEKDPESAKKLHPNNRNYIERALEVFYSTGGKKSEGKKNKDIAFKALVFHKKIFTDEERKKLYEKINERQKLLFDNSTETIKKIKEEIDDFSKYQALNSIGIEEICNYINGNDKQKEIEKMQKRARNYAKRQMTWRRNKPGVNFI